MASAWPPPPGAGLVCTTPGRGRPPCTGRRPTAFDLGLDVARHGQIDHEHRAMAARLQRPLTAPRPMIGAGVWQDNDRVELMGRCGRSASAKTARASRPALLTLERRLATAMRFARRRNAWRPARSSRPHRRTARISSGPRTAGCQAHRGRGHADRMAPISVALRTSWPPRTALEQLAARGSQVPADRRFRTAFHLAQDLRLAQHHRIGPLAAGRHGGPRRVLPTCGCQERRGGDAACAATSHGRGLQLRTAHQRNTPGAVAGGQQCRLRQRAQTGVPRKPARARTTARARTQARPTGPPAPVDSQFQAEGEHRHGAIIEFRSFSVTAE